jgi:hypothetical protein
VDLVEWVLDLRSKLLQLELLLGVRLLHCRLVVRVCAIS